MSQLSQQKAKEKAKERDDYECRFCGVTREQHKSEYGRDLHAHHIIKERDGGADSLDNLITVCRDCHNTLENTQANALSRVRDKHTADLEERVGELEAELDEAKETIAELREGAVDSPIPVFAWLDESRVRVHILLKGAFDSDIGFYTDREKAANEYAEYDGSAKMVSRTVSMSDLFNESLRIESPADVDLYAEANASAHFGSGEEPTRFIRTDIPEELMGE